MEHIRVEPNSEDRKKRYWNLRKEDKEPEQVLIQNDTAEKSGLYLKLNMEEFRNISKEQQKKILDIIIDQEDSSENENSDNGFSRSYRDVLPLILVFLAFLSVALVSLLFLSASRCCF